MECQPRVLNIAQVMLPRQLELLPFVFISSTCSLGCFAFVFCVREPVFQTLVMFYIILVG